MHYLTISDLALACEDLLDNRRELLEASETGKLYRPLLEGRLEELRGLSADDQGSPIGKRLAETDRVHDAYGRAIWYLTEALLRHPTLPARQRHVAELAREHFIPSLAELRRSYAIEAARAKGRREKLDELSGALRRVAVPSGSDEGETLYDWVAAFLEKGEELDDLLSQRAEKGDPRNVEEAINHRAHLLGLLFRFRAVLADEVEENKDLPRDLEARLFSELDALNATREREGDA